MRKHVNKLGLIGSVLALVIVSGSTVFALPSHAATNANATSGQANGQAHLAAAQLKSCQQREKAITNILARIADRGQKQLTLFGTIATRTETFYTDKGKTLSNYDALVADVNAKQAAAQTEVNAVGSASSGFSCTGSDPKGFVTSFQDSLKAEISALQDYRTAVKNLIVGVKSVQGSTTSSANKNNSGGNQ
jgi:hypothetical protein